MHVRTCALCVSFLGACLAWGCLQVGEQTEDAQDSRQPGEQLGFYAVTGRLREDTCGAANLSAPTQWSFEVKLSRAGSTLYWLNGREAIVGDIDKTGSFSFDTRVDMPLSRPHGAVKGCTMTRRDSATGALTRADAAFAGDLSYSYAAAVDSECSEFATGAAGLPLALPCTLTYSLSGTRRPE